MSVHVLYKGRFGNNLFQYVCARLFARKNGLQLATPFPCQDLIRMAPPDPGDWVERSDFNVRLDDTHDILGKQWPRDRYILDGYFQNSEWCHAARTEIEGFAFPEPAVKMNRKDIVISLRLGEDYKHFGWVIHPSWYLEILSAETFDRLHIVVDEPDPEYLAHFSRFDPVVVSSGPADDWSRLRSFDRIVCSNSTFAWWAAFFSGAGRVYTFKRWVGRPEVKLGRFPNGVEVDGRFMQEAKI